MEKKELLIAIDTKRKEGLSNKDIYNELRPSASKIWSDGELITFINKYAEVHLQSKFKYLSKTIILLVICAILLRLSFLALTILSSTQDTEFSKVSIFVGGTSFLVIIGIGSWLIRGLRQFKLECYHVLLILSAWQASTSLVVTIEGIVTSGAIWIKGLLFFNTAILIGIFVLVLKTKKALWPNLTIMGKPKDISNFNF